jgi:PAS domain S-box-containing protein
MDGAKSHDRNPAESVIPSAANPVDAALARRILETAPTILYVYDLQSERSVFQNRSFGELLGHAHTPSDLSEWRRFIHPDDAKRFPDHRDRLKKIKPGEMLSWELRMRDATGDWRWFVCRDALLSRDPAGVPLLVVGNATDITEQKKAEQHKDILAGEMRHRAKNLIPLIEGIGRLSRPKNKPEAAALIDAYTGRLMTLLRTGDLVLSSSTRKADLHAVIAATLAPFRDENESERVVTKGPTMVLPERTAGALALAIHELATNAVKYGALSVQDGSVSLNWNLTPREKTQRFTMKWREAGGPAVSPPQAEGFGGRVIRHSVAHESKGRVALDYLAEGLRCEFEFEIEISN